MLVREEEYLRWLANWLTHLSTICCYHGTSTSEDKSSLGVAVHDVDHQEVIAEVIIKHTPLHNFQSAAESLELLSG